MTAEDPPIREPQRFCLAGIAIALPGHCHISCLLAVSRLHIILT